jgi:amino acid adenylation domain-containing protein
MSAAFEERSVREAYLFPCSFAQERLWFLEQLQPGTPLYNVPIALRLHGPLDIDALEAALCAIIARHEALRTRFAALDGRPMQLIVPQLPFTLRRLPASVSMTVSEAQIQQIAGAEAERPFDLAEGPLLRAALLPVGLDAHVLILTLHHLICDGWSIGVLLRELGLLYQERTSTRASTLPSLPIQYADFAQWQRQTLGETAPQGALKYWLEQLRPPLPTLSLPTDRAPPTTPRHRGARCALTVDLTLTAALRDLGRSHGATLFMTLLSAFAVLLYRYSGQCDLCVGTPIANRKHSDLEALIGMFVNTLAIRIRLAPSWRFEELLERVRDLTLQAYEHQDLPFEHLVSALAPARHAGQTPLLQTLFVLMNMPLPSLDLPGLRTQVLQLENFATARFDLTCVLAECHSGLSGYVEYDSDLFDRCSIERMIGHWQELLKAVGGASESPLRCLPPLSGRERERLRSGNTRAGSLDPADTLIRQFERQVERAPHAPAAFYDRQILSYSELNRCANRVAHHLLERGLSPEATVALCVERSPDLLIGLLGILKAGAAYLPFEPTCPTDRVAFMLEDAGVRQVITQQPLLARMPAGKAQMTCLDRDWPAMARLPDTNPCVPLRARQLAYIIYTSGSTGTPKGVAVEHFGTINLIATQVAAFGIDSDSRVLQFASMAFDASISEIFTALSQGAALVLADRRALHDGAALRDLVQQHAVSIATLPPALLACLNPDHFPCLRTVVSAGEALDVQVAQRWARGRTLLNAYGPTETTVCASISLPVAADDDFRSVPIGFPIDNVRAYILDTELQPLPEGVAGELVIAGAGIARGYVGRPALTAERFLPDPFADTPGARMYRSGDLARYRGDGSIEFLGRLDDQIKLRGFRIEPGEIEMALAAQPGVRDAVVVVHERAATDRLLMAYVVADGSKCDPPESMLQPLRARLPGHMLPDRIVYLEALPLTPNGKVNREQLALRKPEEPLRGFTYTAPRDALETKLVELWERQLNRSPIGVHDNFFDIGGHSLKALAVAAETESVLGVPVSVATLFAHPCVAALAEQLRHHVASPDLRPACLVPLRPDGQLAPLVLVHPLGGAAMCYRSLAAALGNGRAVYAIQSPWLDADAPPPTTILELAGLYLRELSRIITAAGAAPIALGGWSYGALIALEMARQLAEKTGARAKLLLLDPTPIGTMSTDTEDESALVRLVLADLYHSQSQEPPSARDLDRLLGVTTIDEAVSLAGAHAALPESVTARTLRRLCALYTQQLRSLREYVPEPYYGAALLCCARIGETPSATERSWKTLLQGATVQFRLSGDHRAILREPVVHQLAHHIDDYLGHGPLPVDSSPARSASGGILT